jgi:hypothetical protein
MSWGDADLHLVQAVSSTVTTAYGCASSLHDAREKKKEYHLIAAYCEVKKGRNINSSSLRSA